MLKINVVYYIWLLYKFLNIKSKCQVEIINEIVEKNWLTMIIL